ncbi:50S ribosomal protein L10, partial [Candidatus Pacearchaeota archaeon]|nr:50S ribosomal protein L10 [Candidatus Pacearchaeota archaeon]
MTKVETKTNEKNKVPEYKKKVVEDLANDIRNSQTILVASTKNLPGSQFHEIKKKLRGKAIIKVAKKSLVLRAFGMVEKGALQHLKEKIVADVALFFSNLDAFELSSLLSDNLSPAKAKMGDIAPEDISIEPGPTNMIPGPAISELSSVGLKVAVENGKIAIKQGATVVKKGERVPEKVV